MGKSAAPSSFAERFEFTRNRQRVLGTWETDELLADRIGVAKSQISDYKTREISPPAERTLAIAKWCGVDPGWLAFGEDTKAPSPEGFDQFLETRRAPRLGLKPAKAPAAAAKKRA